MLLGGRMAGWDALAAEEDLGAVDDAGA